MTITAESLRPGLQTFAREKSHTMGALQRALDIIYRDRRGGRSIQEITEVVLLAVARAHERRTQAALDNVDRAMGRILADVEASRGVRGAAKPGVTPRPRPLREADQRAIAAALDDIRRFEDDLRRRMEAHDPELATLMSDAVDAGAGATTVRRELSRGEEMVSWAHQILEAWRSGHTLEPLGKAPLRVSSPDDATLVAAMRRLEDAASAYRRAPGSDQASAAAAVDALRAEAATANEQLRAAASGFEAVTLGDIVPPRRALPPGVTPEPGSPAAKGEAVRDGLKAHPHLACQGSSTAALLDALAFSDLDVTAEGFLRESLSRKDIPGVGLEPYILGPGGIAKLRGRTAPPGLAARLAEAFAGWQRAHLVGPGFGSELFAGLMLAPEGVNQIAQRQGVERFLRAARDLGVEAEPTIRAKGRRLAIPLAKGGFDVVDVLSSIHYEIPRRGQPPLRFDITVNPNGSWRVTHNLPAGAPGAGIPRGGVR